MNKFTIFDISYILQKVKLLSHILFKIEINFLFPNSLC